MHRRRYDSAGESHRVGAISPHGARMIVGPALSALSATHRVDLFNLATDETHEADEKLRRIRRVLDRQRRRGNGRGAAAAAEEDVLCRDGADAAHALLEDHNDLAFSGVATALLRILEGAHSGLVEAYRRIDIAERRFRASVVRALHDQAQAIEL